MSHHTKSGQEILIGQSSVADPQVAVREFHAALGVPDLALVLFFCASTYDLDAIAAEMRRLFAGVLVVGCTTAGEIGPDGYLEHSLCGLGFRAGQFTAVAGRLPELQQFSPAQAYTLSQTLLQQLETLAPSARPSNSFALQLIDGLSVREEPVTYALQAALREWPLVGGSAGDGMNFQRTQVYYDGGFHSDSAVLVLVTTTLPFRVFMSQHFTATDERVVVTKADTTHRIVREINGRPALEEYARLVGIPPHEIDAGYFATVPVMVRVGGTDHVRSIRQANPDGSLVFYCAIEEGMVLRLARNGTLSQHLAQTFAQIEAAIGPPQAVIAFDCLFRHLEMLRCDLKPEIEAIFRRYRVVGFSTYGEQYLGMHINQTLTGIAMGYAR